MLLAAAMLVGCGSSEPDPDPVAPVADRAERGDLVVAALGDSIVAGSPLWDPQAAVREKIGSQRDERSQFEYWAERADPALQFVNCGVFGERTDKISERLGGCADGADILLIQGGINDIAQGREPESAAASLRKMVEIGDELGLEVAIADVLPWNNGYPQAAKPIRRLNRLIAGMAAETGATLLPFFATLEDPANRGRMRADWSDDGDHPSLAGYRRLAEVAVVPLLPRP